MPFLKPFAMPLSELLHRLTKGKFDFSQDKSPTTSIDPSFPAENDFVELVWENGQIQSSRARKAQSCNNSPSQLPKVRERDIGYGSSTKIAKCGTMEPVLSEIPLPVTSVEMGLSEDDNMVAWLNYPINESLQHDYTSEFLPQLSGVSVNEHSDNNFSSFGKRSSGDRSTRDGVSVHHGLNLEQGTVLKVSSTGNGEASRPRTSAGELYSSLPQQCQTSFPHFRSTILVNNDDSRSNDDNHALPAAVDKIHPTAGGGFPSIKMQKRVPVPSTTNFNVMNFLHFSRPVASVKASLQNDGVKAGSGITGLEGTGTKNKGSTTSSFSHSENMLIKPCGDICDEKNSSCHPNTVSSKVDANLLEAMPGKELFPGELHVDVNRKDDPKKYKNNCQNLGESSNKGFEDSEKNREPVVASSVCSVNSMKTPSDDPAQNLKRKNRDSEESEGPSEDIGEESVGAKRVPPAKVGRGSKSKRSRAAEVHNLSERRRRDRINEKMRALQELIPNCNKVDKASMLDEAIEYLKTLQLQLQIMSMGSGLYMPSMMLPPGMPHLHTAHMAQFSPMGVRMGMGMPDMSGKASSCSMIQVPPMNGAHFPGPPLSGPGSFHGMQGCNLHMFGLSGQGLPMAFPRAPLVPMPGGPLVKPTMGSDSSGFASSMENLDSAPKSCSKDSIQNINSQRIQNDGAGSSMNQTSQTALVQSNAEVNDNGALQSASGNVKESLRTDGCD